MIFYKKKIKYIIKKIKFKWRKKIYKNKMKISINNNNNHNFRKILQYQMIKLFKLD